jgi:ribosomal protein S18 acetylase RimI-like enzyme
LAYEPIVQILSLKSYFLHPVLLSLLMNSIRRANITDSYLIAAIAETSFIESHGHSASPGEIASYVTAKFNINTVEEELKNTQNVFHIIYNNEQPAGYSKIIFNHAYPVIENKYVTKLERLYLLKEFYDLKLGAALFDFIIDLSKQAGQQGIWLYVWKENERAVKFYKKAGFVIFDHADFKISETHSNPNYIMYLAF